jgi:hypothetical protein
LFVSVPTKLLTNAELDSILRGIGGIEDESAIKKGRKADENLKLLVG